MIDVSDTFLLCEASGSRFSTLGEARRSIALEGEPTLKGFEMAERGVGNGPLTLGERRKSAALCGVLPPDVRDAGVMSWGLLDFECKTRGAGDPLRSRAGDFGGTWGGISGASMSLLVSTFSNGLTVGLRIGDNGFPIGIAFAISILFTWEDSEPGEIPCSEGICEGPVTQDIRASPNGPALQLVPGALLDLSWPKTSVEVLRSGGRPGMVAGEEVSQGFGRVREKRHT